MVRKALYHFLLLTFDLLAEASAQASFSLKKEGPLAEPLYPFAVWYKKLSEDAAFLQALHTFTNLITIVVDFYAVITCCILAFRLPVKAYW